MMREEFQGESVMDAARRVHAVFERLDVKWMLPGGEHVPTVEEIAETINMLIHSLNSAPELRVTETGRIMLSRSEFGDHELYVNLDEVKEAA